MAKNIKIKIPINRKSIHEIDVEKAKEIIEDPIIEASNPFDFNENDSVRTIEDTEYSQNTYPTEDNPFGDNEFDEDEEGIIEINSYTLDFKNLKLSHSEEDRKLTKRETAILKLLSENRNKVIERSLVLNLIWGDDNYFNGRSLDVFITKLRKYLKYDETISINNIHGVGFKLELLEK